jgi:hypothetical protein
MCLNMCSQDVSFNVTPATRGWFVAVVGFVSVAVWFAILMTPFEAVPLVAAKTFGIIPPRITVESRSLFGL